MKNNTTPLATAPETDCIVDFIDDKGKLIEPDFCKYYLSKHPMRYCNGMLIDLDGIITDTEKIRREIYSMISPYVPVNTAKRTESIFNALKLEAYAPDIVPDENKIHFANGTLVIDKAGRKHFKAEKEFCLNRLDVPYIPTASVPKTWLKFLDELLDPEDILTLQEYLGYLLIPSTRGQKMLLIIGKGGEGKSRIGKVLRSIFGDSMYTGSIQKIEIDRFARADLQFKLIMLDDDMKMEALPQTNYLKSLITLEDKIDIERKGRQSEQGILYARFICFGNGALSALYDRSNGFYRRQIILTTKDIDPDRVIDPFLGDKLIKEKAGILLWMLEGLIRLIKNNYQFTISEKAAQNLEEAMTESNNVILFLKDTDYVSFEANTTASSSDLYKVYQRWCQDNSYNSLSQASFSSFLKSHQNEYNIAYKSRVSNGSRRVRGYAGIHVNVRSE